MARARIKSSWAGVACSPMCDVASHVIPAGGMLVIRRRIHASWHRGVERKWHLHATLSTAMNDSASMLRSVVVEAKQSPVDATAVGTCQVVFSWPPSIPLSANSDHAAFSAGKGF